MRRARQGAEALYNRRSSPRTPPGSQAWRQLSVSTDQYLEIEICGMVHPVDAEASGRGCCFEYREIEGSTGLGPSAFSPIASARFSSGSGSA
jgi:hypothetical protein